MKAILLLTDFSKSATNAIHYAMRFFEAETCTFYIMNVHKVGTFISDDLMVSPTENIYESFTKISKQKIDKLILDLKNKYHNSNHQFETIIDFDVFTDAVNQAISRYSIDYVVIGSNGATGAKEILFGSNTINVIRQVICKTLVVPESYKFKTITNFLLPLQFDDYLETKQQNVITELKTQCNYKLHILRTTKGDTTETYTSNDEELLNTLECEYVLEKETSFYQAVTKYLKTHYIDMVGLIVHDKSFIKRFFTESPTIELSKVIQLPILLLHDEKN